jgi:50S ribosomal protein L16 3-hydroxylase
MLPDKKISLLGGLTPRQFLSRHWQKKPLLVRQAVPGFQGPLSRGDVLRLARSPDLESRLVARTGTRWTLTHGPLSRSMLADLPSRNWTLLVQGLNHVLPQADALLNRFAFIPHARLDDVMVSYAVPGGGVGPHLDSYDVFLLQGAGRRRWRIGVQGAATLKDGVPLKILENFTPQEEWVLEAGDMLYLPPGYAHDGVALDACFTYSIGFRAASHQELAQRFLDYLRDRVHAEGRLHDPGLQPTRRPGALPAGLVAQAASAFQQLRWNRDTVTDFLGCDLTEPKPHLVFEPPRRALDAREFATALSRTGIVLDARSLMLYAGARVFLNGEPVVAPGKAALPWLKRLADARRLPAAGNYPAALRAILHSWYVYGFVHIDGGIHP